MEALSIKLPQVVDTEAARLLKSEMLAPFYAGGSLALDASEVERIGTQGLQLLWSALSSFERAGLSLSIHDASQPFLTAIKAAALNLPTLETGLNDA